MTHAASFGAALSEAGADRVELRAALGGTEVAGQGMLDRPAWNWGKR